MVSLRTVFTVGIVILFLHTGNIGVAGGSPSGDTFQSTTESDQITVEAEYRLLPDKPGIIEVFWKVQAPADGSTVELDLDEPGTIISTNGFQKTNGVYKWTDPSGSASATAHINVNKSKRIFGFEDGNSVFISRIGKPEPFNSFHRITYDVTLQGDGVVGGSHVLLGSHTEHTRTVNNQMIRIVVPSGVQPRAQPDQILTSIDSFSTKFSVGERDPEVNYFILPLQTKKIFIGSVTGYAIDTDVAVLNEPGVDNNSGIWIHEYVHTRQSFKLSDMTYKTKWIIEGSAEYYGNLGLLRQNRIGFDEFATPFIRVGSDMSDAKLADSSTWPNEKYVEYTKGGLVVAKLDRQIRLATDNERSFQTVMRRLNEHDGRITQSTFLQIVENVGNSSVADAAKRYTEQTGTLSMWDRTQLPGDDIPFQPVVSVENITLSGPGWTLSDRIRDRGSVRQSYVGDQLRIEATLSNPFNKEWSDNIALVMEEDPASPVPITEQSLDPRTVTLGPGESETIVVRGTLTQRGRVNIALGTSEVADLIVDSTQDITVTDLTKKSGAVTAGENVTVVATVDGTNGSQSVANGTLTVERNDNLVLERDVGFYPGVDPERVEIDVPVPASGEHRISVRDHSITVTAEQPAEATADFSNTPTETVTGAVDQSTSTPRDTADDKATPAQLTDSGVRSADKSTSGTIDSSHTTSADGAGFGIFPVVAGLAGYVLLRRRGIR